MVLVLFMANNKAQAVKATKMTRKSSKNWRSLMWGTKGLSTFSVKVAVGASKAPLAVDKMAESKAPKNRICAHMGIWPSTRSGRMRWMVRASSDSNKALSSGWAISAA